MKRVIFIGVILIVGISIAYYLSQPKEKPLPVINPIDVEEEMIDPELLRVGYGHTIGDFSFYNQNGDLITQDDVSDCIYVTEYFFTTCGTICPKMTDQMKRVQEAFIDDPALKILSFTVNPEVDSVEQMKDYAVKHNANDGQWHFLTGSKDELYSLARTSFFVLKPAEAQNLGDAGSDFIHTNNFVLVDTKKRIRGYYDGTSTDDVDRLIRDINRLKEEEKS